MKGSLAAAMSGRRLEMVKLILELGGNLALRDPSYHATPIAWAAHGQRRGVVDYLMPFATVFDAVQCDGLDRLAALLRQEPSLAASSDEGGTPLVFYLHPELTRLEEMLKVLIAHGANLNVTSPAGKTLLDRALARGWTDFADMLRRYGARAAAAGTAPS